MCTLRMALGPTGFAQHRSLCSFEGNLQTSVGSQWPSSFICLVPGVRFGNGLTPSKPEPQRTPQPMCPRAVQLFKTQKWSRTPPAVVVTQLEFEKHKIERQTGLAGSHTVCSSAGACLSLLICAPMFIHFWGENASSGAAHTALAQRGTRRHHGLHCTAAGRF